MNIDNGEQIREKQLEKKLGNSKIDLSLESWDYELPRKLRDPQIWVICAPGEESTFTHCGAVRVGGVDLINAHTHVSSNISVSRRNLNGTYRDEK